VRVELALDAQAALGEGPAWSGREGLLYWVDILGKRVHAGAEVLLQLDDNVGCAAPRRGGGLALTLSDGFYEWTGRALTRLASVEGPAGLRFNDGK
jgi:sugar lactone lactonase YvrE